jgi:hypothetical protein
MDIDKHKNWWEEAYKIIEDFKKKAEKTPYLFNYEPCNTQIRYALILVDSKWAWWTPYHPGIDVPDTASFVLVNKGDNSIINHCKKYFDGLWEYLEKNPQNTSGGDAL